MSLSRISFDILGRPALDECEIRVETVRPGRTIERPGSDRRPDS